MLKTLGFVQRYGVGIQTAQSAMKRNGNPPIEFEANQSIVVCILKKKPGAAL
jgi:ATP-dependent DNA helicase RecG